MYENYFGLTEAPFSIAPAPRYLYMSQRHQEALAHLLYGVNSGGGFVLLTGEVGAGKTTVCRCLLEQIPENCDVAYIFNPKLTVEELLSSICIEFGIACPPGNTSIKVFVDCINAHLLDAHARGRHAVLIIDEAQNLAPDVLEQMRLLTNLETSERKLLQIILIGQPELATMLERPDLKQLAQRIVARYHLGPLSRREVAAYVRHRLEVAGTHKTLFPAGLTRRLHRRSGGVPRIINVICDRALLGAYVQGKDTVDRSTLIQAEREVLPPSEQHRRRLRIQAGIGILLAVGTVSLAAWYGADSHREFVAPVTNKSVLPPTQPASLSQSTASVNAEVIAPPQLKEGDAALAYTTLFKAWNSDYAGGEPCQAAEADGFRCRTDRGSLLELRRFNRPAVLTLLDEQERSFQAVLMELTPRQARLAIGGKLVSVDLGALAAQWTGEYTLLWRPPQSVQQTLRPGDSGPGVAWVRQQISRLDGNVPATAEPALFDTELAQRIKRFQQQRGLHPDGNVGPKTLILLIGGSDPTAPSLDGKTLDAGAHPPQEG